MVSQVEALAATVGAMELGPEFAAQVALCEGLAEILDGGSKSPGLWDQYRQSVLALLGFGEVEADDGQAALLRLVRTPVGDSKNGPGDTGAGGRGGSGDVGSAVDAVATSGRGRRARASS